MPRMIALTQLHSTLRDACRTIVDEYDVEGLCKRMIDMIPGEDHDYVSNIVRSAKADRESALEGPSQWNRVRLSLMRRWEEEY
jgi:hypothetical protein